MQASVCVPSGRAQCGRVAHRLPTPLRHRNLGHRNRPLRAHASEQDAATGLEALTLRAALEAAVQREDFETAARLKKELSSVQEASVPLEVQLQRLIEQEDYAGASKVRDLLAAQEAQRKQATEQQLAALSTKSDTVTQGVRVTIASFLMPREAFRENEYKYYFAYNVRIENLADSTRTVKLKSRHWRIVDAANHEEHVRGPGVVGKQPVLKPGEAFEYQSFCPLNTPLGSMEGEFQMLVLDDAAAEVVDVFSARIAPFALKADAAPDAA